MSSYYEGLEFKTNLEAKWAAFFDLAGWSWWVNPMVVGDWRPDFKVNFECGHSECNGSHTLLVTVLPLSNLESFKEHPCLSHNFCVESSEGKKLADGGAAFGVSPSVTHWEIAHGAGGGLEDVYFRVSNADELWEKASGLIS